MKNSKELIIIILLAIAVRLPWLVMIPQAEAPDENMHCWVINYISDNCCLPNRQVLTNTGLESAYGSIPPFAYLPHIILVKLFPAHIALPFKQLVTRLGSLLMSLVVVVCAWWVGCRLFKDNRLAAIAVPLLIVFHPQFVFVSAYANNDMTTAALSSLILVNLIMALDCGLTAKRIFILSLLLSWLILSKYSGMHLLIIACLFLPISAFLHKQKTFIWLRYLLTLLFLLIFITGWWFVRNYYQFDGDITGVKTMNHIWNIVYHSYTGHPSTMLAVIFSTSFWRMLFFSFWGWFGYMTHSLPRAVYYGYLLFIILSTGFAMRYWPTILNVRNNHERIWIWRLFTVCIILNLFMAAYCCYAQVSGAQGRYLFPSEIPIMSMLVAGLLSANKKWSQRLIVAMLTFNFFVYCYSTFFIYQLYSQI